MKNILLIILVANALACTPNKKQETIKTNVFIEQKVQEFVNAHDWDKDEATKATVTDKFKHQVIRWSNEPDFLKNMPLQVKSIKDTTVSGADIKVAVFIGYSDTKRPINSLLNRIQLQIKALIAPEMQPQPKVGSNYTITANLYKQGKRADIKYISVAEFKGYDLGKYLFSLTGAKEINP